MQPSKNPWILSNSTPTKENKMNKHDTIYEGIKRFCAERGCTIFNSYLDSICTLVPSPESNKSIVPAIKMLRKFAHCPYDYPLVLNNKGPFKSFMEDRGYDTYSVWNILDLRDAKDIIIFLRDNGLGNAK